MFSDLGSQLATENQVENLSQLMWLHSVSILGGTA